LVICIEKLAASSTRKITVIYYHLEPTKVAGCIPTMCHEPIIEVCAIPISRQGPDQLGISLTEYQEIGISSVANAKVYK